MAQQDVALSIHESKPGKVTFEPIVSGGCFGGKVMEPVLPPPFTLQSNPPVKVKSVVVIYNPFSGPKKNGRKVIQKVVQPMLEEAGIGLKLLETERSEHAIELANTTDLTGVDAICALGGDGTLHQVLQGMLTRADGEKRPLCLLPGGTGNSFCRDYLNVGGTEASFNKEAATRKAVRALIAGVTRKVDAMQLDAHTLDGVPKTFFALGIVGWGLGVDASVGAEDLRWMGGIRYDVAIVHEILKLKKRPCTLTVDEKTVTTPSMMIVMVHNTVHVGKGLRLAPAAQIDDGLIDVLWASTVTSRKQAIDIFNGVKANGSHVYRDDVEYHRAKEMSISTEEASNINIDGENNAQTPAKLKVVPQAYELFVPADE